MSRLLLTIVLRLLTSFSLFHFGFHLSECREVRHKNVVRFIGACTKAPHLCIITGRTSCLEKKKKKEEGRTSCKTQIFGFGLTKHFPWPLH